MKKIKHSKYKNSGLIFELLARQITQDVLNGREQSHAMNIIREYYKNTEVAKEYSLYRVLMNENYRDEKKARNLLQRVLRNRRMLDEDKLKDEKYRLVGEIKDKYPLKEFFKTNISNYRKFASIYKLFQAELQEEVYNPTDVVESESTIIEHITIPNTSIDDKVKQSDLIKEYKKQSRGFRMYAQKLMMKRFNEKYNGLGENQKKLIRKYINNISNTNNMTEYLNSEVDRLAEAFSDILPKIKDDVARIKVDQAVDLIENIKCEHTVYEQNVKRMLMYYQLYNEIEQTLL